MDRTHDIIIYYLNHEHAALLAAPPLFRETLQITNEPARIYRNLHITTTKIRIYYECWWHIDAVSTNNHKYYNVLKILSVDATNKYKYWLNINNILKIMGVEKIASKYWWNIDAVSSNKYKYWLHIKNVLIIIF